MAINTTTPLQVTIYPNGSSLPAANSAATFNQGTFWSGGGPTFKDVLDTINPLQHIPIISSIYQSLTGDVQSNGAKLAGGALFGGPIGFIGSLFDTMVQSATGNTIIGNITHAFDGSTDSSTPPETQTASSGEPEFLSPNQRAAYNAYVHTQSMMG